MKTLLLLTFLPTLWHCNGGTSFAEGMSPAAEGLVKPGLVVQTGHSGIVFSAAISPDGRFALSGAGDNNMILWEVSTGAQIRSFQGHRHYVSAVAFAPDGRRAASGSWDRTVKVWDLQTGKELVTLNGHLDRVSSIAISPDGTTILSGGMDNLVRLWSTTTGKELHSFKGHKELVSSVAICPDGRTGLSASWDGTVKRWDLKTGELLQTFEGHEREVNSVAVSPDCRTAVSGGAEGMLIQWDLAAGKKLRVIKGHSDEINAVAVSPDGRKALSGGIDKSIKLWDLETGKEDRVLEGHKQEIHSLVFTPDGSRALSGSWDWTAKLWDLSNGALVRTFRGSVRGVSSVAASGNCPTIVTANGLDLDVWDIETGQKMPITKAHTDRITSLALSSDCNTALSGSTDTTMKVWNLKSGKALHTLKGDAGSVMSVSISPDGRTGMSASGNGFVKLWDLQTGKNVQSNKFKDASGATFLPDGRTALVSTKNSLKLWSLVTQKELRSFEEQKANFTRIAVAPDGAAALSGGIDGVPRLWSLETGKTLHTFPRHESSFFGPSGVISGVAISADGRTAMSASWDKTIKVWNLATKEDVHTLTEHTDSVESVSFMSGRTAVSGSKDGSVIIWDVPSGGWLAKLYSFSDGTWAVVDPEGRFDTNNLEELKGLHWVMPDAPLTPLPLEIFMREYYEPGLLPRIINGEKFPAVSDLSRLNRVQPGVRILSAESGSRPGTATVKVEVSRAEGAYLRDGRSEKVTTAVHDLRLFRDGRLVGYFPKEDGVISVDPATGKAVVTFADIQLPRTEGVEKVEFTAYTFNDSRIKSPTDRKTYRLPPGLPPVRKKAYVVSIGVKKYENSSFDLNYAAKDAVTLLDTTASGLSRTASYDEVIPLSLVSDEDRNLATKRNLRTVLDLLAGRAVPPEVVASIPGAARIGKATPDDTVIITFSGHGYMGEKGIFYFLLHDTGRKGAGGITPELLQHAMSSDELSQWLRDVDAGEMDMVVDACHSAATVQGEGFKPGPMGSRGLGQLAYDKGMRILAGSQASEGAWEHEKLEHGILTYALAVDGLKNQKADYKPHDQRITMREWLAYGVDRVPQLDEELRDPALKGSRREVIQDEGVPRKRSVQQPALFDFARGRDIVLH